MCSLLSQVSFGLLSNCMHAVHSMLVDFCVHAVHTGAAEKRGGLIAPLKLSVVVMESLAQ